MGKPTFSDEEIEQLLMSEAGSFAMEGLEFDDTHLEVGRLILQGKNISLEDALQMHADAKAERASKLA